MATFLTAGVAWAKIETRTYQVHLSARGMDASSARCKANRWPSLAGLAFQIAPGDIQS